MAEGGLKSVGGASAPNVLTAEATPSADPATTPQPEESKPSSGTSTGAVGGGVPPTSADDKKAISDAGEKIIAAFAKKAGLGELKGDGSHQGNVLNAAKVFAKLSGLGNKDPAMKAECTKFLNELASAGKGLYNWGLKLDGVALNQLPMFKGVDAAKQGNSQPPADGAPQPGASTEGSGNASSAAPTNEDSSATSQAGGKGMSPDDVRTAVTPLLKQVAAIDKKGDANTISLAEVDAALKSKNLDPKVQQLLTIVGQQIQQSGKDMTVADAANHVASMASASQQGGTPQTQGPQSDPKATQPEQPQQVAVPDIRSLNVPQFVKALNADGDKAMITRAEIEQGLQSKDIAQDGKAFLQFLLSKVPDGAKPVTTPKALADLMTSLQAQQAQPSNSATAPRG
jgi:hypothetical protein